MAWGILSGRDERKIRSISCGCDNFEYWYMTNHDGGVIAYLNDENHSNIKRGVIERFSRFNLGRVNNRSKISDLEEFIQQLQWFRCSACDRRVLKNSINGEPLMLYLRTHWDERSGYRA